MKAIIYRHSPKNMKIDAINQKCIFVTQKKYEKLAQELLPKSSIIIGCEILSLKDAYRELKKLKENTLIESVTTLSEEDMEWVGFLNDLICEEKKAYISNALFKNKYYMRTALDGVVLQPEFYYVDTTEKFLSVVEKCKNVIIKPLSSEGARGVKEISENDNGRNIRVCFTESEVLIEEKINIQTMYTCDGYAVGDEIIRFTIHEYEEPIMDSISGSKETIVRTSRVYHENTEIAYRLLSLCKDVLSVLTVKNEVTPFHFEWFYDGDNLIFCEVGKRFGGAKIPRLIEDEYGFNVLAEYWDLLINGANPSKYRICNLPIPRCIAMSFTAHTRKGKVSNVPRIIENDACIKEIVNYVKTGELLEETSSFSDTLFSARIRVDNEQEYREKLDLLRKFHSLYTIER